MTLADALGVGFLIGAAIIALVIIGVMSDLSIKQIENGEYWGCILLPAFLFTLVCYIGYRLVSGR